MIMEVAMVRTHARLVVMVIFLVTMSTGCSSLITVNSDPKGASIRINGRYYGVTPSTFKVPSSTFGSYQLTLEKDGYDAVVVLMEKEWYQGRLIAEIIFPFLWPALFFNVRGPVGFPHEHFYRLVPEAAHPREGGGSADGGGGGGG